MLAGPVFHAELVTTARRARYYAIRFAYGMILLFFVVRTVPPSRGGGAIWEGKDLTIGEMAATGSTIFLTLAILQGITILVLTPALVSGVVADEKRRKTLHYLMASQLSSAEIILGKLFARLLHIGVFLAIGMPVLSLVSLFGGIEPLWVVGVYAGTLSTAVFLASVSLLISTLARRPREAGTQVYLLEAAWLFLPTIISYTLPAAGGRWIQVYEWIKPVNDPLCWSSPFSLVNSAVRGSVEESVLWMIGLQAAAAVVAVLLSIALLRPIFRREGGGSRRFAWLGEARRGRRFLSRPEVGDDAMLWKERYVSRTSGAVKAVGTLILLVVVIVLGYTTYQFAAPAFVELWENGYGTEGDYGDRSGFNAYLRGMNVVFYVAWALAVASAASTGLVSEREEDTWTSLTTTPLAGEEILRAKMFGAVWGTRWLGLLLVTFWLIGVASGAVHPFGLAAVAIETVVFIGFAAALGVSMSVGAKTSTRAQSSTMMILLVVNGVYLACCLPSSGFDTILVAVGVTPLIEGLSLLSYRDFSRLVWNTPPREFDAVMTCVLGVVGYGVAALALTTRAFATFDTRIDRPRRNLEYLTNAKKYLEVLEEGDIS